MTYKLSQIDRTLLSAYLDGEVSPAERLKAEHLLKSSEEARNYLHDLHAVNHLSVAAIAAPGIGAAGGASAVGVSAKLTGSAIQAAARRAGMAKASALSTWGIAGLASAAAVMVAGVALSVRTPSSPTAPPVNPQGRVEATSALKIPTFTVPAIDIDTNNLLVPPMTTADLCAFALHGTLPIDAKRERFITLATRGKDSLQVKVHSKAPEDIGADLASIEPREAHALDSIQRVIRTSLVHYANGGLALRADIPQVRLATIRSLERIAPRISERVREELDRTRMQLLAVEQASKHAPSGNYNFEGNGSVGISQPVSYMMIYQDPVGMPDWSSDMLPQDQFVVRFDNEPSFTIDQRCLGSLQMRLPTPPTPPAPPAFDDGGPQVMVGNAPPIRFKRPRVLVHIPEPATMETPSAESAPTETSMGLGENGNNDAFWNMEDIDRQTDAVVQYWLARQRSLQDMRIFMTNQDSMLRNSRMLLDSAGRSIHRVDSIINRVRIRYREFNNGGGVQPNGHGGGQSIQLLIESNDTGGWDGTQTSGTNSPGGE